MSGKPKVCPLLMLAATGSDLKITHIKGKGRACLEKRPSICTKERCAWWNDDFGMCAIAALALASSRPVVVQELGGDLIKGVNDDV